MDNICHNFRLDEAQAYIQKFGVLVRYAEPRVIATHRSYVQFTDLKDWVVKSHALMKSTRVPIM